MTELSSPPALAVLFIGLTVAAMAAVCIAPRRLGLPDVVGWLATGLAISVVPRAGIAMIFISLGSCLPTPPVGRHMLARQRIGAPDER